MTQLDQRNQQVDRQFNAGRDQTIQNILLVGQFLDFSKIEGLIPERPTDASFTDITATFQTAFAQRLGTDLAEATARAGSMLKSVLKKWPSRQQAKVLPFRRILKTLPDTLVEALKSHHYWDSFCTSESVIPHNRPTKVNALRLDSTGQLWNRHFHTELVFLLVEGKGSSSACIWLRGQDGDSGWTDRRVDPAYIRSEQFRVLAAGLVIDLIRIASTSEADAKFWNSLTTLLAQGRGQE